MTGAAAALVALAGLLAWFAYSGYTGQSKTEIEPETVVRAMVLTPENADQRYTYAGEVRGRYESHLAFQVGGKILSRNVELGSVVRPGQVLMEIDDRDIVQMVNAQKAQVAQAKSQLQLAEQDMRRYRSLVAQDVVSRSRFEQVQTLYEVAQAGLEQAEAQYTQGVNQFGYTKLKAGQAGVVSAVSAEVGQVVGPGQIVVSVVQDGEREIELTVPENRIDAVRKSSDAQITFWALPGLTIAGKIREIAPMADPALRTYKVRVTLYKPSDKVRLGMTASVKIADPESHKDKLFIPLSALYQTGNIPRVWVIQNGVVHLQPLKTGAPGNDQIQVLSGLNPGDVIITAGVHKLREGQKVKAELGK